MGDMCIGHDKSVASHLCGTFAAGFGAAVDGGAFADVHSVTNLHPAFLSFEFEVLGNGAHDGAGKYGAVLSHSDMIVNGGSVEDFAAVADFHVVIDKGEGADFHIISQLCSGIYTG